MRNAPTQKGRGVASLGGDSLAYSKVPVRPKARLLVQLADGSTFQLQAVERN